MLICTGVLSAQSETETDILNKSAKGINWETITKPEYPSYYQRSFWNSLPGNWQQQYIRNGEKYVNYDWPAVTASSFLKYMQEGDRKAMERINSERRTALFSLVMAELVEGEGRFINPIIDGVFAFSEQTSWCNSAHLVAQKAKGSLPDVTEPIIDLGAVITGEDISMVYYFFKEEFDKINPLISQRIEYEINHRLLQPYYEREDFWWMAFNTDLVNNWNVWCNANVLKCMWIIERDPKQRTEGINKIIRSADKFVDYYKNDGACEEGPEYWGHAGGKLYELIETLNAMSGGKFQPYTHEKVKNIGRYIGLSHISRNYFVNFADASPRLSSYPGLIKRIGSLIDDEKLECFARELAITNRWKDKAPSGPLAKVIPELMLGNEWLEEGVNEQVDEGHFFAQTGMCVARDKGSKSSGFFFAAKGGHNNESHNHNDVGSFVLYYKGQPFMADAGVGTYTGKTFSSRRYEIWNMQSQYHNLPLINGVGQKNGKQYKAKNVSFNDDGQNVRFSLNMEEAYPNEAYVKEWKRQYDFTRTEGLTITDKYHLEKSKQATELHYITPCEVIKVGSGKLELANNEDKLFLYFDANQFECKVSDIENLDERLSRNWPKGLKLVELKMKKKQRSGTVKISIKKD